MNSKKISGFILLLVLLFSISCSNDKSESGVGHGEVVKSAEDIGAVETDGGPELCGGIEGRECGEGEFCELPEGQCLVADSQGTCIYQPQMCTRDYRPVCGCDGRTYGNDCERQSGGVQKDYDGECKKDNISSD